MYYFVFVLGIKPLNNTLGQWSICSHSLNDLSGLSIAMHAVCVISNTSNESEICKNRCFNTFLPVCGNDLPTKIHLFQMQLEKLSSSKFMYIYIYIGSKWRYVMWRSRKRRPIIDFRCYLDDILSLEIIRISSEYTYTHIWPKKVRIITFKSYYQK